MNRLTIVFRHGAAMGLPVDMQTTAKAKALLGAPRKKSKHIPAMPWREVPEFLSSLREGGMVDQCLTLLILTACRSGKVRAATWDEFDLSENLWTIPADRMKVHKEHRVPLTAVALKVLKRIRPHEREGFVFPSARKGCVSDMAMGTLMRRRGLDYRPHGFRSSFRDWCDEETDVSREAPRPHAEVVELLLAKLAWITDILPIPIDLGLEIRAKRPLTKTGAWQKAPRFLVGSFSVEA